METILPGHGVVKGKVGIIMAGAIVGFLGAVGIYFEPREPYQHFIVIAGTVGGALLALLISAVVDRTSTRMVAFIWGALLGFLQGTVIFLAKGGWVSWDAPFVVPTLVVSGIILGPIVRRLNSR